MKIITPSYRILPSLLLVASLATWVLLSPTQQATAQTRSYSLPSEPSVSESPVEWISLEEALKRNQKKKSRRPILIDFYTDWCGWCKRMDAQTFADPQVAAYLNNTFWAVKFDAESRDPVEYLGEVYEFQGNGKRGTNGLALKLAASNGRIGYPTVTFLDEEAQPLEVLPGFKNAVRMDELLKYYGEGYYRDFDFQSFLGFYTSPLKN